MLVLGLVLAGCGTSSGANPPSSPPSGPQPTTTAGTTAPVTTTAPSSGPATTEATPSPFGTRPELPLDPRNEGSKVVSFESTDGIELTGRTYGAGSHGVVLAPSGNVRYSQFEWLETATRLAKAGYHVLTFDVRGICYTPDPNVGCSEGDIDWGSAWQDVEGAVAFMKDQGANKVVVMGGDLGATEAIYAASKGMKVDGIISVSGLNDSEGYEIDKAALRAAGGPMLFIVGKDDTDAFDTYREWLPEAPGPKQGLVLDTDTRGTFLFDPILPTDIPLQHKAFAAVEEFLKTND